jgi:hypothetical protein
MVLGADTEASDLEKPSSFSTSTLSKGSGDPGLEAAAVLRRIFMRERKFIYACGEE